MDRANMELHDILNGQSPVSIGGIPTEKTTPQATEEVNNLGPNPSFTQTMALVLAKLEKTENEMKTTNKALAHHLWRHWPQ